jgi:lysophospholipase L1-like esterase
LHLRLAGYAVIQPQDKPPFTSTHVSTCACYVASTPAAAAAAEKQLTVSVVGASISAGIGAEDAPAWVDRLEQYLKDTYGKVAGVNITVNNGAVPGTTSAYMAACVNLHVPRDADIIIVEYSVNDDWQVYPPMDNPVRCARGVGRLSLL